MSRRPVLAVSVGCAAGIGPEVAVLAAARSSDVRCVLVGDLAVIERAAAQRRVALRRLVGVDGAVSAAGLKSGQVGVWAASTPLRRLPEPGRPDAEVGAAQLAWIDEATDVVQAGIADALVTGPVSKAAIASSGAALAAQFLGHTEHLARRLEAREVVMAFRSEQITTALVTTHLPLAKVPAAVTCEAVATSAYWLVRLLAVLGKKRPKLVVAALNPHAGEGGLLGHEETRVIEPGIAAARERLLAEGRSALLAGPVGAETAFRMHGAGAYDGVLAMYHDQATIPCKLLGFGEAVNVTLGLPLVRTSVDHGTAYDLAGTRKASPQGMLAALDLAARLCRRASPDGLRP